MKKLAIGGCLEIVRESGTDDYIMVLLALDELTASRRVYSPLGTGGENLADFFSRLAANSQGWSGEEMWESLEGDFSLCCSHDGVRCVAVQAKLSDVYRSWKVEIQFVIELGMLDELSTAATHFCESRSTTD